MPDQKSEEVLKDRSPGFLYMLVLLFCIFLMLAGLGVFNIASNQLPEIYSTALTLCLSCIGLGEINFQILGWIALLFVITMVLYFIIVRLIGGRNGRKN